MKRLTYLAVAVSFLFGVVVSFNACKKESNNKNNLQNHLSIDGVEYELSWGLLGYWGEINDGEYYSVGLGLYSSNLSLQGSNGIYYLHGDGDTFEVAMYISSSTEIPSGTYPNSVNEDKVGTFSVGSFVLNYTTDNVNNEEKIYIYSGTITVNKDGSNYEIELDCTAENGKKVTGYYYGALEYVVHDN